MSTNLIRLEDEVTMGAPSIEILPLSHHFSNGYRSNQLMEVNLCKYHVPDSE